MVDLAFSRLVLAAQSELRMYCTFFFSFFLVLSARQPPSLVCRCTLALFLQGVRKYVRMQGPLWNKVSSEAKELIQRLMAFDPGARLTVDKVHSSV